MKFNYLNYSNDNQLIILKIWFSFNISVFNIFYGYIILCFLYIQLRAVFLAAIDKFLLDFGCVLKNHCLL